MSVLCASFLVGKDTVNFLDAALLGTDVPSRPQPPASISPPVSVSPSAPLQTLVGPDPAAADFDEVPAFMSPCEPGAKSAVPECCPCCVDLFGPALFTPSAANPSGLQFLAGGGGGGAHNSPPPYDSPPPSISSSSSSSFDLIQGKIG
ncbi:Hypothetical protein NTJ_04280 [Nesidiocoris tenuis]|uniref:Uncharacterized protein n=1 Tax=Nesidiocoris tenuis TaxID=355587 RepID=A0ABN7AJL7_9HEMI|nr:Hypothetical protein NTJ_04280 [Nesidiocoris tenuis]